MEALDSPPKARMRGSLQVGDARRRLSSPLLTPVGSRWSGGGSDAEVPQRSATTMQATTALFKAVVGTGVFAYPPAVREAGYMLTTAVAVFFFVINLYTMRVLNLAIVAMRDKGVQR
jgi:hypothetical protein